MTMHQRVLHRRFDFSVAKLQTLIMLVQIVLETTNLNQMMGHKFLYVIYFFGVSA